MSNEPDVVVGTRFKFNGRSRPVTFKPIPGSMMKIKEAFQNGCEREDVSKFKGKSRPVTYQPKPGALKGPREVFENDAAPKNSRQTFKPLPGTVNNAKNQFNGEAHKAPRRKEISFKPAPGFLKSKASLFDNGGAANISPEAFQATKAAESRFKRLSGFARKSITRLLSSRGSMAEEQEEKYYDDDNDESWQEEEEVYTNSKYEEGDSFDEDSEPDYQEDDRTQSHGASKRMTRQQSMMSRQPSVARSRQPSMMSRQPSVASSRQPSMMSRQPSTKNQSMLFSDKMPFEDEESQYESDDDEVRPVMMSRRGRSTKESMMKQSFEYDSDDSDNWDDEWEP